MRLRSRVKNEERDGGKPCDEPLSEVKDCPNDENAPFCPSTTSTTSPNTVYVVAAPGEDPLKAAGIKVDSLEAAYDTIKDGALRWHQPSANKYFKSGDDTNKALKPADDTITKQTESTQTPKPCIKNEDLKAALDSYPREDAQHLVDAMATLKKANEKAEDPVKGKKVSDFITQMHLYAANADDFITSIAANAALKKAMGKLMSVDEKNIKVEMTLEGAFMKPTWKKHEQGNVKADVTVQIFENDNIGDPKLLADGMAKSLTADKVTAAIQKQLAEANLGQFDVHATYMSVSQP